MPTFASNRKIECLLFAAAFFAYGYFHQGGGWAQNARFAMVRAVVEEGRYWIDDYLIYVHSAETNHDSALTRLPVKEGTYKRDGSTYVLTWLDDQDRQISVSTHVDPSAKPMLIQPVTISGDLSYAQEHFYPAKTPGISLLAAVPYFIIYHAERLVGANPDDWWTLTCNAWLTCVFSVGLLSAFGCVLVFRLARALSSGNKVPSVLTAIAFAFGTMFFPQATMLQDQNIAGVFMLASFYLLYRLKQASAQAGPADEASLRQRQWPVALSGCCAGYAAITNYVPAAAVPVFGAYLVWSLREPRLLKWFALGVVGPFLLICVYNFVCFGAVFTTNYRYMNIGMVHGGRGDVDLLMVPHWDVALTVLFSPFRGMFVSAPVLLMGVYGLWHLVRGTSWRLEAGVFTFVCALYLLFNASFWGWHGGWTAVPRYLDPAVPFLAVPMVFGFIRFPRTSASLALVSIMINLLFTAVDPQVPTGFKAVGNVSAWSQWRHAPLLEHTLPMFLTGRAGPILEQRLKNRMTDYSAELDEQGIVSPEKDRLMAAMRERLKAVTLTRMTPLSGGPVSGNPVGIYESVPYNLFPPGSGQAEWNSFNAGEFLFPQSRLSLLPLLLVCGGLLIGARRVAAA